MTEPLPIYEEDMNVLHDVAKRIYEKVSVYDPRKATLELLTAAMDDEIDESLVQKNNELLRLGCTVVLTKLIKDIVENIFDTTLTSFASITLIDFLQTYEALRDEIKRGNRN